MPSNSDVGNITQQTALSMTSNNPELKCISASCDPVGWLQTSFGFLFEESPNSFMNMVYMMPVLVDMQTYRSWRHRAIC